MSVLSESDYNKIDKSSWVDSGFVMADNSIIRSIIHKCNLQCVTLYLVILSHKNKAPESCYPSLSLLAEETNQNVRTVKRQLKELEEGGFIETHSGTTNVNNNYFFPQEKWFDGYGVISPYKRKKAF